jgi:tetratricopeptide (TPR) repeat protein
MKQPRVRFGLRVLSALGYVLLAGRTPAQDRSPDAPAPIDVSGARTALDAGDYAYAEAQFRAMLGMYEGPEDAGSAAVVSVNLGRAYEGQGKLDEAEALYRRTLASLDQRGAAPRDRAPLLAGLVRCSLRRNRLEEAEALARQALAVAEAAGGPGGEGAAVAWNDLAKVYALRGKYAEAEPLYRKSLAARPDAARVMTNLAALLRATGRAAEAGDLEARALAARLRQAEALAKRLEVQAAEVKRQSQDTLKSLKGHPDLYSRYPARVVRSLEEQARRDPCRYAGYAARALDDYAAVLREAGRPGEAGRQEARAKALRAEVNP